MVVVLSYISDRRPPTCYHNARSNLQRKLISRISDIPPLKGARNYYTFPTPARWDYDTWDSVAVPTGLPSRKMGTHLNLAEPTYHNSDRDVYILAYF
jgi:hypothetical protein